MPYKIPTVTFFVTNPIPAGIWSNPTRNTPMLALLNFFKPTHQNWQKIKTHEGVRLLFPEFPTRKCSQSESPLGTIHVTLYSGKLPESNFSAILSVRDYTPIKPAQAGDYFQEWKDEFNRTMELMGISTQLVREAHTDGKHPRCDLLFVNHDETVYTRVGLISQGTRLVILFAVGMLQEVSGPACSDCFRSLRLA